MWSVLFVREFELKMNADDFLQGLRQVRTKYIVPNIVYKCKTAKRSARKKTTRFLPAVHDDGYSTMFQDDDPHLTAKIADLLSNFGDLDCDWPPS